MAKAKEYRALVGISYPNPDYDSEDAESTVEPELRAEAGDKITDVPDDWARVQTNQGNLEKWRVGKTENVRDSDDGVFVEGVISRHQKDGEEIVLKGVNE